MKKIVACAIAVAAVVGPKCAPAGELWQDYADLISRRTAVGALGDDMFGDQVSYYTGGLSFAVTDVDLPGNGALPVRIRRTYNHRTRNGYPHPDTVTGRDYEFGDWEMDLPRVGGVFSDQYGWVGTGTATNYRCSKPAMPPSIQFTFNDFQPDEYFNGLQASFDGHAGEMLGVGAGVPIPSTGGPYVWLLQDRTVFSCLTSTQNAAGEGFVATTPDGTRYRFDWMAANIEAPVRKARDNLQYRSTLHPPGDDVVPRHRLSLYATRVEDRHGNWVEYHYGNTSGAPIRLESITSSDGRTISLTHNANGQVETVTAVGKTWTYGYTSGLSSVQLPDGSHWDVALEPLTAAHMDYERGQAGDPLRTCMDPGGVVSGPITGSITHPSGAKATYTLEPQRMGRSNVLAMCKHVTAPINDTNDDAAIYPIAWDSYVLTGKTVEGAAVPTQTWSYTYLPTISWFYGSGGNAGLPVCTGGDCVSPQCVSDTCAGTTVTTVYGPGDTRRYTFGNSYRYNEGKLLKLEILSPAGRLMRTETYKYQFPGDGLPYAARIGYPLLNRIDAAYSDAYLRPEKEHVITQDGTFTRRVDVYDVFARPVTVTRSRAD